MKNAEKFKALKKTKHEELNRRGNRLDLEGTLEFCNITHDGFFEFGVPHSTCEMGVPVPSASFDTCQLFKYN